MKSIPRHSWFSLIVSSMLALLPFAVMPGITIAATSDSDAIVVDFSQTPTKPPVAEVPTTQPAPAPAPTPAIAPVKTTVITPPADNDLEFLPLLKYITSEDNELASSLPKTDAASTGSAAQEVFEWKGSLMFPLESIRILAEMMKVYDAISRGAIVTADSNTGTPTVAPRVPSPSFFINSIIYRSPKDWIVWVNGEKIPSDAPETIRPFTLENVTKNRLTLGWRTTELDQVFPDWKQYFTMVNGNEKRYVSLDGTIHINLTKSNEATWPANSQTVTLVDNKVSSKKQEPEPVTLATITAVLNAYQTFRTSTMEIVEGKTDIGTNFITPLLNNITTNSIATDSTAADNATADNTAADSTPPQAEGTAAVAP